MSRWKVRRTTNEINPWVASFHGREGDRLILHKTHHGTWREAMNYADQQARTVQVTLPRRTTFPTPRHHLNRDDLIMEWEQSTRFPNLPPKYLTVHPDELRPLALALLAQHYRKEQE